MIIDQQSMTPNSHIVSGANYSSTYPGNAAAFNFLDIYKEILTFSLKITRIAINRLRG